MSWDVWSPVLGPLLSKSLPKDTYTVWKRGSLLRVDGHMKGLNEDTKTMLPQWKYGHFSILIDMDTPNAKPLYVSHDKRRYTPLDVRHSAKTA